MINTSIINQKYKEFLCFLILAVLSSCQGTKSSGTTPIKLDFPETQKYSAVIKTNDELIVLVDVSRGLKQYAKEGDTEFTKFTLIDNVDCSLTKTYVSYETLPDGRLQVWKKCVNDEGGVDYLLAYDWDTGNLEKIVGPLPLGSSGASWNPDQTKAIGYLGSGFATRTLYWIYPNDFEALDLVIQDGDRSWNLKDDFPKFEADDTGQSGSTGRANWSPDGRQIAFFASPNAIGKTGFSRFYVEHYLYLMNPETLEYQVVAHGIYSPFLLAWSPDSDYIAFLGERGFFKQEGLWLYSTKTNTISKISDGMYQSIVWRSNTSVVVIQCEDYEVCDQVVEYDVSSLLDN